MNEWVRFEWDERKNRDNRKKHGVTFEEAETVFYDEQALLISDPDHSEDEQRFILLGYSSGFRLLVVCHGLRKSETMIRLISARRANRSERNLYEQRRKI